MAGPTNGGHAARGLGQPLIPTCVVQSFRSLHSRCVRSTRRGAWTLRPAPAPRASPSEANQDSPSQGWAPGLRARFRIFELTCAPSSPTPINSARASAPSIRRPRRPHRPAQPPEPPPPAVWALPPPHPAPQSPLFLALPGAQDLGFHGARNGRGEGASVPILDDGAGGRRPSRPGRSSATPRCGKPYERWTRRTRPGSALDLEKKRPLGEPRSLVGIFGKARVRKKATWVISRSKWPFRFSFRWPEFVHLPVEIPSFCRPLLPSRTQSYSRGINPSHASGNWEGETTSRRPSTRTKVQHGARHRLKGRREGDCRNRLCLRQRCERCAAPPRSPR